LAISYNTLQKRLTDLENHAKNNIPVYEDLQIIMDRVNESADKTTGSTEAVAGAKLSATTPEHRG
jgi:hypothetical protein